MNTTASTIIVVIITVALINLKVCEGKGLGKKVIFGVNAGGPYHEDVFGVRYSSDDTSEEGVASDFGKRFDIQRVPPEDQVLYQTERYSTGGFGYDIPIKEDGNYVLVLKFCEVYFRSPRQKVFNIKLNREHLVLPHLDIFQKVGIATAHDEYIPFQIKNKGKTILVMGMESTVKGAKIPVTFEMGTADNPKVNALYVIKGILKDIPQLPPLPPRPSENEDDIFEESEDEVSFDQGDLGNDHKIRTFRTGTNKWIRSGPEALDPWEFKSNNEKYFPVMVALASSFGSLVLIFAVMKL